MKHENKLMRIELQKLRMMTSEIGSTDDNSPGAIINSDDEIFKKNQFNKNGSYGSSNL